MLPGPLKGTPQKTSSGVGHQGFDLSLRLAAFNVVGVIYSFPNGGPKCETISGLPTLTL